MKIVSEKPIGQLVAEDYRTAQIFKKHKINFYFLGSRTIKEVAEAHKLDAQLLLDEIETVQRLESEENINFISWPLDLLVDYIEKKHHRYVKKNAPIVKGPPRKSLRDQPGKILRTFSDFRTVQPVCRRFFEPHEE